MKILAVTACPSGVAHTYIAAEAIRKACKKVGADCKVETQGFLGIENEITVEDIKTADAVILTTDMPIKNQQRFDSIKQIKAGVGQVIREADDIVSKIISTI